MKISFIKTIPKGQQNLLVPFFAVNGIKNHFFIKSLSASDRNYIQKICRTINWPSKENYIIPLPSSPNAKIVLFFFGEKLKWQRRKLIMDARKIIQILKANRLSSLTLRLNDWRLKGADETEIVSLVAQNFLLAEFEFSGFKEKPKEGLHQIKNIFIIADINKKLTSSLGEGIIIGQATNEARRLSNTPAAVMTPKKLSEEAKNLSRGLKIKVRILNRNAIKKLKMGGVLAVSQGSKEKPYFIILEYGPSGKTPIVFAGKGLTFDSGGLNIKPSESMNEMHMDMSGGAAVIGAITAIAKLKLPIRVVGLIPAVENMPSGSSYHTGDLIKTIIGKTVEVLNTDAEGRIILADALGYAQKYKPSLIVDAATLTGAAMVALGQRASAIFSNQEELLKLAQKISEQTGDYGWPMPLWEEYEEEIKGTFGDIINVGKTKYGGAIIGAMFLKNFVGNYPWIHLDIAPTMTAIDGQFLAKGASGAGVRFLVEIAKSRI